jgi:hypothetical protein
MGTTKLSFADHNFEDNARDGHGNDWPIRYKDIALGMIIRSDLLVLVVRLKIGLYYLMDNSYPYGFEL